MNQCNFIGNLGKDPELRSTQGGKSVCSFTIAVNSRSGDKEHTEWINVVAWDKTAENVSKYCTKGKQVRVTGRMQTRKWQDKEGTDRYTTEIVAYEVQFLGGGKKDEGSVGRRGDDGPGGHPENPPQTNNDEDIPF